MPPHHCQAWGEETFSSREKGFFLVKPAWQEEQWGNTGSEPEGPVGYCLLW